MRGTMLGIVMWDRAFSQLSLNVRLLGPMVLWICIAMMGLMIGMLSVWRLIKQAMFGNPR